MENVDVNIGLAWQKVDSILDAAVKLLPNLAIAFVTFFLLLAIAKVIGYFVRRSSEKKGRHNLGAVLGSLVFWTGAIASAAIALTILVPTLNPGDLIAGLGIGSVAIGFAFKDILQNLLAGLLILLRQPFEVNDQIEVNGMEGTVERIESRATLLKTYDGQRIVIPNSDIYTDAVTVRTAFDKRRSEYDVGVGYGDDLSKSQEVIRDAISKVEGVEKDPAPEALPWDLAASWVTLRARWWTDVRRADRVQVRAKVLRSIKDALDEAGIDMPYDTQVQLFHDQTEAHDGDRDAQREGWPRGENGSTPRWRAEKEEGAKES